MKIKFLGIKKQVRQNTGCPVCRKRVRNEKFTEYATITMPSGIETYFKAFQIYEIANKSDYDFLISFKYKNNDKDIYPFQAVNED